MPDTDRWTLEPNDGGHPSLIMVGGRVPRGIVEVAPAAEVDRLRAALEKIAAIPTVRLRGEGKDHHGEVVSVREAVDVAREGLNGGESDV